ncbi:MAG: hypothetical protein AAGG01_15560, partial [Planctomycetota bacterium]
MTKHRIASCFMWSLAAAGVMQAALSEGAGSPAGPPNEDADVLSLLDTNGDGRIDRFEAAEAVMAWVEGSGDGGGATADSILAFARDQLKGRGDAPGSSNASTEARDPEALFEELNGDDNRYLGPTELAAAFVGESWRLFDSDGDSFLGTQELKAAVATQTASAAFSIEGATARLRGVIDASTPGRLLQLIVERPEVKEIAFEHVPGAPDRGIRERTARLLASSGLAVRIPRGALVAADAAEVFRSSQRRFIEPGAIVLTPAPGSAKAEPARPMGENEIYASGLRNEAETLQVFATGSRASLRGLAGVSSQVAWATGSGATVLRTVDGGASFTNVAPPSIEGLDVRDVHALSESIAWILTAGPGDASR